MQVNVLYLTNNGGRASTTVATRGWIENLLARGLRPVLVSPLDGEFFEWARSLNVPTYNVDFPWPNRTWPLPFVRSLWTLRRIVKKHGVQLIHSNEQDVYPTAQYLARICRLPVVVSIHFTLDRGFCEWAFGGVRQPDRMYFISKGNIEACRDAVTGIVPNARWRLLYNGVDINYMKPETSLRDRFRGEHDLNGHRAIGVACALRPRKQLEHLFEAAARLPGANVRILVAGAAVPGDENYAEELIRRATHQLGDRFLMLGYLYDLRSFYNGLDVFVNTSEEEACSISVIESLSCGCPVLGYPSKSVDDQVLPGGGEMVSQNNVDELSQAMNRWISDPEELMSRRVLARRRAEEKFDVQKIANQLWTDYETLVRPA